MSSLLALFPRLMERVILMLGLSGYYIRSLLKQEES